MRSIGESWNPVSISAMSVIFGSLTGALASSVSTWITQRHQDRRDLLAKRIFHREQLYSDFISESARVMADAIQNNFQDPSMLLPAYALLSRMRLSSSSDVLDSAELIIQQHHQNVFGTLPYSRGDSVERRQAPGSIARIQQYLPC
jgi:hypothetical protein